MDGSDPIYEIEPDATQEELLEYFRDRVHIDLDEQSHVLTVTTEGFNPEYGVRFLRREIQNSLEDRLSELLLWESLQRCQRH